MESKLGLHKADLQETKMCTDLERTCRKIGGEIKCEKDVSFWKLHIKIV